jgi:SAM-dependent methyltransferase
MSRSEKLMSVVDPSMRLIEVGPSHSPLAPKAEGWHTCVVDHAARDELVEKYRIHPVDVSRIEEVDLIWTSGPLDAAFPPEALGTYDAIIASHVLEHIPDLIGVFRSFERLLLPTGVVSVAVPDKRFCFDFFKSLSSTADLLEAAEQAAVQHSRKTRFEEAAYGVVSRGEIGWGRRPVDQLTFPSSLVAAKDLFGSADAPGGPYIDCHAWRFTPSSFQLAILELDALEEIHFSVDRLFATEGNEFHVTLRRGRDPRASEPALTHARLELLGGVMAELQEQATWFMRGIEGDVNDQIQGSATRSRLARLRSVVGRDPA